MILYFDSSALSKVLLVEAGSGEARDLWNLDAPLVSSWIAYAETSAAIGAAVRGRRISRSQGTTALRRLAREWESVIPLEVDCAVATVAGTMAVRHGLRGMDAIHLSSALSLEGAELLLVTWDRDLGRAAQREGLATAGATTD